MRRLLLVLAWADCQEASWLLAAGHLSAAARRMVMAVEKLKGAGALIRRSRTPIWRPVLRSMTHR